MLLDHETSLLDQVDGACESKPFQSKQDAGCFGKKPKPRQDGGEGSSSGSFSEGSDINGPIRMVSAKPTYATQTIEPVQTKTATAPVISSPTTQRSKVTLTFEPATPLETPGSRSTNRGHQRRGSGFPFSVPDEVNDPGESPSASMKAVRRPTDLSLDSFDSARVVRIHTPPTGPSSNTGSLVSTNPSTKPSTKPSTSTSTKAGPKSPSVSPIIDEPEVGSDDSGNGDDDEEDSSSDESPGNAGVQRFTTALEE